MGLSHEIKLSRYIHNICLKNRCIYAKESSFAKGIFCCAKKAGLDVIKDFEERGGCRIAARWYDDNPRIGPVEGGRVAPYQVVAGIMQINGFTPLFANKIFNKKFQAENIIITAPKGQQVFKPK